ncbi:MAG: glycosyltransferase [Steroidobacteraceae bacterium]
MFSVVINHYSGGGFAPHLAGASIFSASLSRRDPLVKEVLVVDGSQDPDPVLQAHVQQMGCQYLHAGRRLSFAEGYNFGASRASEEWVVLCASDVFPSLDCYAAISGFLARINTDTVGCIIPRLTSSDLPYQKSRLFARHACVVPIMTLNFNVMKRSYLESIGGVPVEYSGNYNDIGLSIRIHDDGKHIYMLPVRCVHYGSLTLQSGVSNVSADRDRASFAARHPHLVDPGSIWDLRVGALMKPGLIPLLLYFSRMSPTRHIRSIVARWILRLVPLLSAIRHP